MLYLLAQLDGGGFDLLSKAITGGSVGIMAWIIWQMMSKRLIPGSIHADIVTGLTNQIKEEQKARKEWEERAWGIKNSMDRTLNTTEKLANVVEQQATGGR